MASQAKVNDQRKLKAAVQQGQATATIALDDPSSQDSSSSIFNVQFQEAVKNGLFSDLGREGLSAEGGQISESFTEKLQWPAAYERYDEMRRRSPTLRAMLQLVRLVSRLSELKVVPAQIEEEEAAGIVQGPNQNIQAANDAVAAFVDSCFMDLSQTKDNLLDDLFSMIPFGWSWAVIHYKRRQGNEGDYVSKENDGLIGWRKFMFVRQSSFSSWGLDEQGNLQGMTQAPAPDYKDIYLPLVDEQGVQRGLHFVMDRDLGNPEGFALFESAFEPYYYSKQLQIIAATGHSRTAQGVLKFVFERKPTAKDLGVAKAMGMGWQFDEKQYLIQVPGMTVEPLYGEFKSAQSLLEYIQHYEAVLLRLFLADFLMLGAAAVGSWALGKDRSELFVMAVNGLLGKVADVFNRHAIPALVQLNGGRTRPEWSQMSGMPEVKFTEISKPDLDEVLSLGKFYEIAAALGKQPTDEQMNDAARRANVDEWPEESPNAMPEVEASPTATPAPTIEPEPEPEPEPELKEHDYDYELAENPPDFKSRLDLERQTIEALSEIFDEDAPAILASASAGTALEASFWRRHREKLLSVLSPFLRRGATNGATQAGEAIEAMGIGLDFSLLNQAVVEWLEGHGGELVKGITATTKEGVRRSIREWIKSGAPLTELEERLAVTFGEKRAQLIASTEVTRAYAEGNLAAWRESGVVRGKVWRTTRDERVCPICAPLDGQVVELDRSFNDKLAEGVKVNEILQHPPAHPRCRCWVSPEVIE